MSRKFKLAMVMLSCPERVHTRAASLRSLGQTDWKSEFQLVLDEGSGSPSPHRLGVNQVRALRACAHSSAEYVLLVEDDVMFNAHLEHNVQLWLASFRARDVGSLYRSTFGKRCGTQAIITSSGRWSQLLADAVSSPPEHTQPFDEWLAKRVHESNFRHHSPSLVQHNAHASTCGRPLHRARNYDQDFRA